VKLGRQQLTKLVIRLNASKRPNCFEFDLR
jgi:hypothetical protein